MSRPPLFSSTFLQHRIWLIGLAALAWPPAVVKKVWQTLKKGEIAETDLRVGGESLRKKIDLTNWQFISIKKFFTEYTFTSFLDWLNQRQYSVLTEQDVAYPALLRCLDSAPPVLWYQGDWDTALPLTAVIGTRHPTPYGLAASDQLVRELVTKGWGIVSGFMYGADIAAQQQALEAGGHTVGVLGFGLQQMYPTSHRRLVPDYLAQGGVLISPFAPWAPPRQWRFLERNKVVAGLARALLVTEALPQSGTHSTVAAALDLGRPVGVLPSPITSPFAAGASLLANQGALLVHSADQLLGELTESAEINESLSVYSLPKLPDEVPRELEPLARVLKAGPSTVTNLTVELNQPVSEMAAQLSRLELLGLVIREGAWFRWRTQQMDLTKRK
jgi:DNA processing protein